MRWTLPNILSVARLIAAAVLPLVFLYFTRPYADWFALVLFVVASVTDYIDGYLARSWGQITRIGQMIDPIADKAMVVIALMVIVGYSSMSPWLVLPATFIVFREIFVSGLREFLGQTAGTLSVTRLAKWKTFIQMIALAVLFGHGIFEHHVGMNAYGMDQAMFDAVIAGDEPDTNNLRRLVQGMIWSSWIGLALLWVAAVLTLITGWDYFRKAWPYLKE